MTKSNGAVGENEDAAGQGRERMKGADETTVADVNDDDGTGLARDTRRTKFRDNFVSARNAVYVRNAIDAVHRAGLICGTVSHAKVQYRSNSHSDSSPLRDEYNSSEITCRRKEHTLARVQ